MPVAGAPALGYALPEPVLNNLWFFGFICCWLGLQSAVNPESIIVNSRGQALGMVPNHVHFRVFGAMVFAVGIGFFGATLLDRQRGLRFAIGSAYARAALAAVISVLALLVGAPVAIVIFAVLACGGTALHLMVWREFTKLRREVDEALDSVAAQSLDRRMTQRLAAGAGPLLCLGASYWLLIVGEPLAFIGVASEVLGTSGQHLLLLWIGTLGIVALLACLVLAGGASAARVLVAVNAAHALCCLLCFAIVRYEDSVLLWAGVASIAGALAQSVLDGLVAVESPVDAFVKSAAAMDAAPAEDDATVALRRRQAVAAVGAVAKDD